MADVLADIHAARSAPWRHRAACRGMGHALFFPSTDPDKRDRMNESIRLARQTCARCPVQAECLAIAGDTGIWAGTTGRQRKTARARAARTKETA